MFVIRFLEYVAVDFPDRKLTFKKVIAVRSCKYQERDFRDQGTVGLCAQCPAADIERLCDPSSVQYKSCAHLMREEPMGIISVHAPDLSSSTCAVIKRV